jgi:hypothetical protein
VGQSKNFRRRADARARASLPLWGFLSYFEVFGSGRIYFRMVYLQASYAHGEKDQLSVSSLHNLDQPPTDVRIVFSPSMSKRGLLLFSSN